MKIPRRQWGYVTRVDFHGKLVEETEEPARFWTRKGAERYVEELRDYQRENCPVLAGMVRYEVVKLGPLGPNPYMLPEAEYQRWCRQP